MKRIPKLCRRKDGRAYVTDPRTKKEVYLGTWDTPEAEQSYERWRLEFLAAEQRHPGVVPSSGLTVGQLIKSYLTFAQKYYVKRGKTTSEYAAIQGALARILPWAEMRADAFSPSRLKDARDEMVNRGWTRDYVNEQVGRIRRCWRWAVENELCPSVVLHALEAVTQLRKGRTEAQEQRDIKPVPLEIVEKTIAYLPRMFQLLVALHYVSGMRCEEIVALRLADIDRRAEPWVYGVTPDWNKKDHLGDERRVPFGPSARAVIAELARGKSESDWLFPSRGRGRRAHVRGNHLTVSGYYHRITSVCKREYIPHWFPLQLRHAALTRVRERYGLEGSQVIGGHDRIETSQIYAEKNWNLARRIAEEMG
jgi:integrase